MLKLLSIYSHNSVVIIINTKFRILFCEEGENFRSLTSESLRLNNLRSLPVCRAHHFRHRDRKQQQFSKALRPLAHFRTGGAGGVVPNHTLL